MLKIELGQTLRHLLFVTQWRVIQTFAKDLLNSGILIDRVNSYSV